jgi:hypothetical protein
VASISFPTVKKLPRSAEEEEEAGEEAGVAADIIRIRTASRGQVRTQVMMVESAEAPKMMGISNTSPGPAPTKSVNALRKNSLKPGNKGRAGKREGEKERRGRRKMTE